MKRLYAFLLICLLALPSALAIPSYEFDRTGSEKTRVSSGTGGTVWYGVLTDKHWDNIVELTNTSQAQAYALQSRLYTAWGLDSNGWSKNVTSSLTVLCQNDEAVLLSLRLYHWNEEIENYYWGGYGDYVLQNTLVDVRTGLPLRLSDLFYDGFNYIDYINQAIIRSFSLYGAYMEQWFGVPSLTVQRQPFTGFPRDYPYFTITEFAGQTYLELLIDNNNPFFSMRQEDGSQTRVRVPLTHAISPYGGCYLEDILYDVEPLGSSGARLYVPTAFTLDSGAYPEAEARILQQIPQKVEEVKRLVAGIPTDADTVVRHSLRVSNHQMLLNYTIGQELPYEMDVLAYLIFGAFDCDTGEYIGLEESLSYLLYNRDMTFYQPAPAGTPRKDRIMITGYRPSEGTRIICQENVYGELEGALVYWLHLQEPSGAYVDMLAPESALPREEGNNG